VRRGTIRLATWNINGINARLPLLLRWLNANRPDIVCLQELKAPSERFPRLALEEAGYGALWRGEKAYNGVAILARGTEPVLIRDRLPGDPADLHQRYIEAAVAGVVVGCLYLPNGNPQPGPKFDYKLAWFERLIAHARKLKASKAPAILAGDFNVVPTDADIYPTSSYDDDALMQPESRTAWRKLLRQGWTDAIRALHPDAAIYTYWDYFRNRWPRNAGLRIDHILLSAELTKRLRKAGVDRDMRGEEKASDHAPAWVDLQRI
jgi:exodeoxyribonuclease III